ncbi:AMP-binding protein [Rubrivivax sp. RP6-9]|uniref:AMP-binding protein n=1 Tax=Rubrivivax sp. RP6-9 TaxID=3415750 RepID=UPI003CC5B6C0
MNFAIEVERLACRGGWLDARAFVTPGREWSHAQVHRASHGLARLFQRKGLVAGSRLLLALDDSVLWVAAFLACARLGATALVVNPHLGAAEHERLCARFQPRLALVDGALAERFSSAVLIDPAEALRELAHPDATAPDAADSGFAPLYVQFTSGTTGEQKAVPHRHEDMLVYRDAVATGMLGLRREDLLFSASRMFFAYGLGNSLAFPLTMGASAVLLPRRPSGADALDVLLRHPVDVMFWVPSGFASLMREAEQSPSQSLRLAVSAGEALSPGLASRLQGWLRAPVLNQLGSTEAGHAYCGTSLGDDPAASVGRVLPGYSVELRDPATGSPAPPGGEGEVWLAGPTVPRGYWRDVTGTARGADLFVGDWFRTGDKARRLVDGRLQHLGRVDDIEKVGGMKLSPLEVEAVLSEHPDVAEVAVASVVHRDGASRLWAFVVCRRLLAHIEPELRSLARARLAPFMVPKFFVPVERLPRTTNGKLQRHVLRSDEWIHRALSVAPHCAAAQPLEVERP